MKKYLFDSGLQENDLPYQHLIYLESLLENIKRELVEVVSLTSVFYRVDDICCASIDIGGVNKKTYCINLTIAGHFEWPDRLEEGSKGIDISLCDTVDSIHFLFFLTQKLSLHHSLSTEGEHYSDLIFRRSICNG